jgi:MoxR-like ATPase
MSQAPDGTAWSSIVTRLFAGRATADGPAELKLSAREGPSLAAKLRQAYYWIVNNAIIAPYYDIEYGEHGAPSFTFPNGDVLQLPREASYCSYVLLPLLTFATRRRALLVGGPGKGKTATAILMGILAGYTHADVRRSVQHGHPQLTIADLLGTPLPSAMMEAKALEEVKVSWRRWLTMRVKIVDEYNRIPTKTQSALLSLMAEGYAEMFDQIVEARDAAWFLTANDDVGGGTFQVIEALKDRIDLTIKAMPFNSRFLGQLLQRVELGIDPNEVVPADIIFTPEELDELRLEIRAVPIPTPVLRRLEFFVGQLEFCQRASVKFEYKNKDTLRLAGIPLASVCNEQCPLDKTKHLCAQTQQGLSVRSFQTILDLAKAIAYLRSSEVTVQDLRQVIPFALHEKITANAAGDFFQIEGNRALLSDKIAWIRRMFDEALAMYDQIDRDRNDVALRLAEELDRGLEGVPAKQIEQRMNEVQSLIQKAAKQGELAPWVYEDLIRLKAIYMRYQNQLLWLRGQG